MLLATKEDDPSSVIRRRLEAAGASLEDLQHVHLLGFDDPEDPKQFEPLDRLDTNLKRLEQKIEELGDVKLLVIDPVPDFAGKLDIYRDNEVRALLTPLARIARRFDLAVVVIIHINKKEDQSARNRALGGVAFVNAPRSAVAVGEHPEQPEKRVMVQAKRNLTGGTMIGVTFTTTSERGARGVHKILWDTEWSKITADELFAPRKPKSKVQKAEDLLLEILADGPVLQKDIIKMAEAEGIKKRSLDEAKKALEVKSARRDDEWEWRLPDGKDAK